MHLKGYHATRLTDTERLDVLENGLEVLSVILLERRLNALVQSSVIGSDIYDALRSRHQAADDNRANKLWFVFTRSSLKDEG